LIGEAIDLLCASHLRLPNRSTSVIINTSTPKEDTIMDTLGDERFDNDIQSQREIIRQSLSEIVNDIGIAMRDVGLCFPVFMTVRDNGDSLATIATPVDPSDQDWEGHRPSPVRSSDRRSVTANYGTGNCSALLQTRRR
jgi:hypothetical protein